MEIAQAVKEIRDMQAEPPPAARVEPSEPWPRTALPPPVELPTKTEQMRDAIREVVGNLAADVLKNLKALREQIDDLERMVVADAARVTDNLTGHANICGSVQQEIARLSGVLEQIRAQALVAGEDHDRSS
jgi:hypothetical protein